MSFDPRLPDDSVNVTPTHPLREALVLVAGVVGAVALFAASAAFAVDWLVPRLPVALETRLFGGDWLPGRLSPEAGEPHAEQAELQALLERLAARWDENPYRLRVAIWEREEPNAFALPGGWIGVTRGLLDAVGSENELAFVLAHEIGHFAGRHHLRGFGRQAALGVVLLGLGLSGVGPAGDVAGFAGRLAQRRFDREQESEADAFGLDLLAAEYGHAAGAADFFRRLPEPGDGVVGERLGGYVSTHPVHGERVRRLEARAREQGLALEGPLTPRDSSAGPASP